MQIEVYDTQVGASATVLNALRDTSLQYASQPGFLKIIGRHETTSTGQVRLDLWQGQTQMVNNAPMTANDNMNPNAEDDIIADGIPCVPGQLLRAQLRETTGNATDLIVKFLFTPAPAHLVAAAIKGGV